MKLQIFLISFLVSMPSIQAAESMHKLFGVHLGEIYNCNKCGNIQIKNGSPIHVFREPVSDPEMKVFYDFAVIVSTDSGFVSRIKAQRYFEDGTKCSDALDQVKLYLIHKYGKSQSKYPTFWAKISQDKLIEGNLSCSITEGEPYYKLELIFSNKRQVQIINDSFKKVLKK